MAVEHPVVVITGAGSGIGRACAVRFGQEGARVVVVDRNDEDGQETVAIVTGGASRKPRLEGGVKGRNKKEASSSPGSSALRAVNFKSKGTDAVFVHADVSAEDQCRHFAEAACDAFGRIDVLVANAGVRVFGTLLESTEADWDKILGVNLKGVSFSCKAVLPKMIEQQSGAIVLIGSTTALTGRTNMPLYDATKFGVLSLTRSLAATYGADGIRVNAVCPSFTLTNFHFQRAAAQGISPEELRGKNKGYGLLGRPGEPEEIAAVVSFMAGRDASFVTGQYLIVDGGYSIGGRTSQK